MQVKIRLYSLNQMQSDLINKYKGFHNYEIIYSFDGFHFLATLVQIYPSIIIKEAIIIHTN